MNAPRLTHNAHADRASVSKAGIADPAFHPSLPDFAPTPLRPAPKAAQRLGVRSVLVKDESQRLGMPSFKILGASWATYRTIMAHLGLAVGAQPTLDRLREAVAAHGSDLTLVAATDGNHGRAVARMAKLLGLGAIIVVPAGTVDSRIDAITGEGAEVRVVERRVRPGDRGERSAERRQARRHLGHVLGGLHRHPRLGDRRLLHDAHGDR